jgi:uncharacterized membrane protein YidH (DUF202 family)
MKKLMIGAMLMGPMVASAQALSGPLGSTLQVIFNIISFLIPLLLALAVLVFFWGLVKYIMNASDEAAKESGKTLMIWGMIALFVMVAFWGIIGYVQSSFGISGSVSSAPAPSVASIVPTL